MKHFLLVLFAAVLIPAMCSCSKSKTEKSQSSKISTLQDLHGKKAASVTGSSFQEDAEKTAPDVKITPLYFNDTTLCVQAVLTGKADAVFLDEPMAQLWVARYPDKLYAAEVYAKDSYSFAIRKNSPLTARISRVIEQLEKSGELAKFKKKWCGSTDPNRKLEKWTHKKDFDGSAGVLSYATDFTQEPMAFSLNGQYVGMDIEVIARVAYELNMKLEITSMNFGSLLEALLSKKVNVVGGSMSITPTRQEKVDFVTSYYQGGQTIVAPYPILVPQAVEKQSVKQPFSVKVKQICSGLKNSFDRTFIRESRWRLVLDGLMITVIITIAAAVLGTILAFPVWLLRTAKNKFARSCGKTFIYVMQGTPILVLLMVLYYLIFASVDIHAVLVAIIGFALNFAAYAGEMLRTGIDSIPKGQREAALALGFNRFQTFAKVILPQALRQILPIYRGEFINMLKSTSVVGYIAIQDLTKASDIIRSRTYEAFFPLIATALIYFVTAWFLAGFLVWLDNRLDPAKRRSKKMEAEK